MTDQLFVHSLSLFLSQKFSVDTFFFFIKVADSMQSLQ